MKKTVSLILALMTALFACLSACVAEEAANTGKVQKYGNIGRLSKLNITEDELNDVLKDIMVDSICDRYVFYDTMNDMLMALFCMLLREEDAELRDQISACIAGMNEDGTIELMKQTYIEDVIAGEEPDAIEPDAFPGAETIKVAVTGDRPPMDYVSASGNPLGFNTALITEVAKRLEMNVEMVNVSCAARGIALATGVCDIVFWMEVGDFENWEGADFEDQPENTVVTDPYMSVPLWWAVLKDSPVVNVYRDN